VAIVENMVNMPARLLVDRPQMWVTAALVVCGPLLDFSLGIHLCLLVSFMPLILMVVSQLVSD
jgi:hypothetical protein